MSIPKIYVLDMGWSGCLIAVAFSEEEAREMMSEDKGYSPEYESMTSYDIMTTGLKCRCWGDS